ncbi:hypothetical protein [Niabella beijingensis]|uniref:hypothetical protein n=1 Tax=Niabella beijingensis TaxID=2872700 RepID=UPI001CBE7DA2|nr:hypothetical protein [Niabella beijingensis]MBZ4191281.1 hypothetical protein [Niabella beijingensis]
MKNFFYYALLLMLLSISCNKNKEHAFADDPLIRSIHTTTTDILPNGPPEEFTVTTDYNFRYDDKRLIAVNDHHLFYDGNNRLSWSRMEWRDSTAAPSGGPLYNQRIRRFSYKWKNNAVDEIYLDSSYDKSLNSNGQIVSEGLQTGVRYARFFRSGVNRVDSVVYLNQFNDGSSMLSAIRLLYEGDNVSKAINYLSSPVSPNEMHFVFVTESLHSSISDPLFRIYKELTILPFPMNYIPSRNYLSKYRNSADQQSSSMPAWNDITYQFNERGWPIKSVVVNPSSTYRSTTVFSYY